MQEGDPHLAATARPAAAVVSPATARDHGLTEGGQVSVQGSSGSVTVPVAIDEAMIDGAVWLPLNSEGCRVYRDLGVGYGETVRLSSGGLA